MGRIAAQIILDEEETETLKHWQRASTVSLGLCFRARIVLDCAAGYSGKEIAQRHAPVSKQCRSGDDALCSIGSRAYQMPHEAANRGGTKMRKSNGCWKPR